MWTPRLTFGHLDSETIEKSDSLRIMVTLLTFSHWEPETIEKSDTSHILNISLRIGSLGARDERKVGLVTHSIDTTFHDQSLGHFPTFHFS